MKTTRHTANLPPPKVDWFHDKMRTALASRDFTTVYRQLQKIGFSQMRIGGYARQSQPEISAIIKGREVVAYDVIKRIITGLGIPACLAGMGSCCHDQCDLDHAGT